jgi:hypothetical protein
MTIPIDTMLYKIWSEGLTPPTESSELATLTASILCYGPPGCGKTFLAEALFAAFGRDKVELDADVITKSAEVPLSGVLKPFISRFFFKSPISRLLKPPKRTTVPGVLIEEIDNLVVDLRQHPAAYRLLLDVLKDVSSRSTVFVTATRPEALLPNELETFKYFLPVFYADQGLRETILAYHASSIPLDVDVDLWDLAGRTEWWSALELKELMATAPLDERGVVLQESLLRRITFMRSSIVSSQRRQRTQELFRFSAEHCTTDYILEDISYRYGSDFADENKKEELEVGEERQFDFPVPATILNAETDLKPLPPETPMETPISVLERHFDLTLSAESLHDLNQLSFDRWHDFAIEYKRYAEGFREANLGRLKKDNELAPYLFEYLSYSTALSSPYAESAEVAKLDQFISSMKRLLLYHHRVYIPDWFLWLLDYIRMPSDLKDTRLFHLAQVQHYLGLLVSIKPLFEAGIVNLIPTEALTEQPIGSYVKNDDIEWVHAVAGEFGMPEEVVIALLDPLFAYQINALDLNVDMIFPRLIDEQLFERASKAVSARVSRPVAPTAQLLEKLPMPRLDNLTLEDLVLLRRKEQAFEEWRDELIQIWLMAKREPVTIEQHAEEFTAEVSARLRGRQRAIIKGAEASGFWDRTKDGLFSLGMGIATKAAAEVISPGSSVAVQLLAAFAGGGLPILVKFGRYRWNAPVREALTRVYSIFDASER